MTKKIDSKSLIATLIENESNMFSVGTMLGTLTLFSFFVPSDIYIETKLDDKDGALSSKAKVNALLKQLTVFQLYCLYHIDTENLRHKKYVPVHRQSLLYGGIKSLPQNVKDVMYNIFHILHPYESEK